MERKYKLEVFIWNCLFLMLSKLYNLLLVYSYLSFFKIPVWVYFSVPLTSRGRRTQRHYVSWEMSHLHTKFRAPRLQCGPSRLPTLQWMTKYLGAGCSTSGLVRFIKAEREVGYIWKELGQRGVILSKYTVWNSLFKIFDLQNSSHFENTTLLNIMCT